MIAARQQGADSYNATKGKPLGLDIWRWLCERRVEMYDSNHKMAMFWHERIEPIEDEI